MDQTPGLSIFQNGSINVENARENLEEAEDLEDQKRRQEEIRKLLMKNMDEFNYDDQSTINSSTNVSLNDCEEKYKNSSMNDQIKVLYDIRVREIKSLTQKVDELESLLNEQKSSSTKKLILSEAEKERALFSLKQSQELLITKNEEINKLLHNSEILRTNLIKAEENYKSVSNEVETLKLSNGDLIQQLMIMKQGFNTNTISERQMQENLNSQIDNLHYNLDSALKSLEQKEQEVCSLQRKLSQAKLEKEEIISEKSGIINKLTGNLDNSQQQYMDILQKIEMLTQENAKLKCSIKDLEKSNTLGIGLSDKTEIIKVLQKELEKVNIIQMKHLGEYEKLQQEYYELNTHCGLIENNLKHLKIENKLLQSNLESCEINLKSKQDEIRLNQLSLEKNNKLEVENKELLMKINELNFKNKNCIESSMQTSYNLNSFCTQTNESLYSDNHKIEIEALKSQLINYEEEINELKLKICLENEREQLIQNLQQKALLFEQVIQENNKPKSTVGTNTENNTQDNFLLNELFETELIEKEIELRVKIEEEFANKLKLNCHNCAGFVNQIKQFNAILDNKKKEIDDLKKNNKECNFCEQLSEQLQNTDVMLQNEKCALIKIKNQQLEDREILIQVLDEWRLKFEELETQNQQLNDKLFVADTKYAEILNKLETREKGDSNLVQELQMETEKLLKDWNVQAMQGIYKITANHYDRVLESTKKIDNISKKTDRKVKQIEEMFSKSKEAISTMNFKD